MEGSGIYSERSSICRAAIHTGVVRNTLNTDSPKFTLVIASGQNDYTGSLRNGVNSTNGSSSERSFVTGKYISAFENYGPNEGSKSSESSFLQL